MSEPALALTGCATITVPALIAGAGDRAALRFLEFFTVNIRNANTRAAYARAAGNFLLWCETRAGRGLKDIQPVRVAAYIEELQGKRSTPTVKQRLAYGPGAAPLGDERRDAGAVVPFVEHRTSSAGPGKSFR